MTKAWYSIIIWFRTVLFFSLIISSFVFYTEGFEGATWLVVSLPIGLFITIPMLAIIWFLIGLSFKLPYTGTFARIWFCSAMVVAGCGYAVLLLRWFDGVWLYEGIWKYLACISISIILAVESLRVSFFKLQEEAIADRAFK